MWVALFSNSGSELAEVCNKLGKWPDIIFCDKYRQAPHKDLIKKVTWSSKLEIDSYLKHVSRDTLVTLHGYLRILPPECITKRTYNVHPGDIFTHPVLRGIHPQQKAIDLSLKETGVLIHKVDEGVDTGQPQIFIAYEIKDNETVDSLVSELRELAIKMWCMFLPPLIKDKK